MKKTIIFSIICAMLLVSCNEKQNYKPADGNGYLVLDNLQLDESTKAVVPASGNYTVIIKDSEGEQVVKTTYSAIISSGNKISLPAGSYSLEARSTEEEVPAAAFEQPVYGISRQFTITSGQETNLGQLVCTLLQCKVTVSYNDDFLKTVTGDGAASVKITEGNDLSYQLKYNSGNPTYEQSAGYFSIPDGSNTVIMTVDFKGSVDGKMYKMQTKPYTVSARQWHQVKIVKKVDAQGNASIVVEIDDYVQDSELVSDVTAKETVLGPDPFAPTGDGGIKLESTCSYDITQPIVVPAATESFVLTMLATIPNKVKKFTVDVDSTNPNFVTSVKSVNGGSSTLDLVNPSSGAIVVFTTIIPFPYGPQVADQESIAFDLSKAHTPILAFSGTHYFKMNVVDHKGCSKSITVTLVVK